MCKKMIIYLFSTCYSFVYTFKAIKKVKVTYQGQGHTSRSRSNQGQHQIEVIFKERYSYAGGLHLNQMRSCLQIFTVSLQVEKLSY